MTIDYPDWRDKNAYPNEAPLQWWAWQFLRRNREYQADYAAWAETAEGRTYDEDLAKKWGVIVAPDPAIGDASISPDLSTLPRPLRHGAPPSRLHESILRFDLRVSIDRQIKYAKEYLTQQVDFYRRVHVARGTSPERLTAKGKHKGKLDEYLFAFDAKSAGADIKQIAAILYPALDRELTRDAGIVRAEYAVKCGKNLVTSGYIDLMQWA